VIASSGGPAIPYFTPHRVLRRRFARFGLEVVDEGTAGAGTWFAARLP
jgi:hypothetical protein